jgi:hypothetical protein
VGVQMLRLLFLSGYSILFFYILFV